jgi:hypothetical protein
MEAPSARRAGKEPVPEYNSDSDTAPATLRTPTPSPASTRTSRMSSTSGRTLRIPSPKTTLLSNPYQGRLPGWL